MQFYEPLTHLSEQIEMDLFLVVLTMVSRALPHRSIITMIPIEWQHSWKKLDLGTPLRGAAENAINNVVMQLPVRLWKHLKDNGEVFYSIFGGDAQRRPQTQLYPHSLNQAAPFSLLNCIMSVFIDLHRDGSSIMKASFLKILKRLFWNG